jgi:hypothetical protein
MGIRFSMAHSHHSAIADANSCRTAAVKTFHQRRREAFPVKANRPARIVPAPDPSSISLPLSRFHKMHPKSDFTERYETQWNGPLLHGIMKKPIQNATAPKFTYRIVKPGRF